MAKKKTVDVELTAEMRKNLEMAGAIGYTLDEKFPYVPKLCRLKKKDTNKYMVPKELWPIFFLKTIDGVKQSQLEDETRVEQVTDSTGKRTIKLHSGKARLLTLKEGVVGWKNYTDGKGGVIPQPVANELEGGIELDSIKYLHPALQTELANAINENSRMNDADLLGLKL